PRAHQSTGKLYDHRFARLPLCFHVSDGKVPVQGQSTGANHTSLAAVCQKDSCVCSMAARDSSAAASSGPVARMYNCVPGFARRYITDMTWLALTERPFAMQMMSLASRDA